MVTIREELNMIRRIKEVFHSLVVMTFAAGFSGVTPYWAAGCKLVFWRVVLIADGLKEGVCPV
jgi:hypothetical protein